MRLRERATKGAGSRTAGVTMAFELVMMARRRWRRLNAPHPVAQVRAGVAFNDGVRHAREEVTDQEPAAA